MPVILRASINFCWFFFKWGMILAVLAAVGVGFYVYTHLDREIQQYVEKKLESHYRGKLVRVGGARFIEGRGIEIRGVRISEPRGDGSAEKLLELDEIFVVCSPSIADLIQDKFEVHQIILRRPRLWATRRPGGQWSLACLLPSPKFGGGRPELLIENATVELIDPLAAPVRRIVLRDGNFRLQPAPLLPTDAAEERRFAVQGTMAGDFLRRIQVSGQLQELAGTKAFSGVVEGVELGPELLAALPANWVEGAEPLRALRGRATIRFEVATGAGGRGVTYRTACQLSRGRIEDPRLPYPLTDVEAYVRCQNGGLSVDRLSAWNGQTHVNLSCQRQGLGPQAPLTLTAKVRKLMLNRELVQGLPAELREVWRNFLPEGEIDLDLKASYDGVRWHPDLTAQFGAASFTYHKFPYHLHRCAGALTLRNDVLQIDFKAHAGDFPVSILGEVVRPGKEATGWVEVRAAEMQLDERLVAALPPEGRATLGALNPQGRFQLYWRGHRAQPNVPMQSHLEVALDRCSVRFTKFPYPVSNIRGSVEMTNGAWVFRNLEGSNDTGFVTCNGELQPTAQGPLLTLRFAGTEVPLDEELRNALAPAAQRLWSDLKPQGRIDLTADATYHFATREFHLATRIKPLPESASIEPTAFPYRMEKVRGVVNYVDGAVTFHELRAEHGGTRIATDGHCQMQPDGSWYLSLENLTVDRLAADRELMVALPPGLRHAVGQLNPTGLINLRGSFGLVQDAIRGAPLKSQWDIAADLHGNSADAGILLSNLHGEVRLTGNYDGQRLQTHGELDLDSVNYGTMQVTGVRGPLWIDNDRVLFGSWAQKQMGLPNPRRLTGQMYGGELVGDGWATLNEPQQFALQTSLRGADLVRLSTEGLPGRQQLQGKMSGDLELRGTPRSSHSLAGSGNIRLREADIYELPVVMQLLKVLRVRLPDKTAFTQSDMYFRVNGEHLYFDKLDLLGDALSLYGKGEVGFNHDVQLTFHSVVGRNDFSLPALRNLVGEASEQIMQVHVRGTLENPEISNEPFPVVNQALQQLQADLAAPAPRASVTMDPRSWLRPEPAPQRR